MNLKISTYQYIVIFFVGFLISLVATFYQHIRFDLLNSVFETASYVDIDIKNTQRLPIYPYFTLLIFKIFGSDNYLAISIIQSLLNGLTIFILFAIKNFFTKKFFWISLFLLGFNINFFWSSTIILPDSLYVFFLTTGMFFFLKFICEKQLIFYVFIGSIFLFFASLTKPVGLLLPFFLSFFLLFFLFFKKKYSFLRIIICSFIPILFCNLLASKINYKLTGKSINVQKSSHLLYWVYPCLNQKWGCGNRNLDSFKKVQKLSEDKIKKLENIDYSEKLPDNFVVKKEHYKIQMDIFYDEIKRIHPVQILTSTIGSTLKLLLHTPTIVIFERHSISYKNLKSIISFKNFNFSISGSIWLFSQLFLIFLRLIQLYGLFSIFTSNSKKLYWSIMFLVSFILPFLITSIGMGNFRYRIPLEPALFILTILGFKKINKKIKLSLYKR